jgi:hypothetical protein
MRCIPEDKVTVETRDPGFNAPRRAVRMEMGLPGTNPENLSY